MIYVTLYSVTQEHLQGTLTPLVHTHAGRTQNVPVDCKRPRQLNFALYQKTLHSNQMKLRRIKSDDAENYYELYRSALSEVPLLFLESLEEFEQKTVEDVQKTIVEQMNQGVGFLLGAFDDTQNLFGFIGFRRESSSRLDHIGCIWGLYVSPKGRGVGLGKALIQQTLRDIAQIPGIEQVKLQLEAGNHRAKELYEHFGFKIWGTEPRAVRVDGVYYDDYHMILKDLTAYK